MENVTCMEKNTLRTCSRSDPGIRQQNEDACEVCTFNHPCGMVTLLAVADGLGGHPAGEVASSLAVTTIRRVVGEGLPLIQDPGPEELMRLLATGFHEANAQILAAGARDPAREGMGTTLVAAVITDADDCVIGNIGDSRAYLVSQRMRRVTQDHSRVQELVEEGILTPGEAERHPLKHIVTRILGRAGERPDLFACRLGSSRLMLCSDGLLDGLTEPEIHTVMRGSGIPGICDTLIGRATVKSRDNITVAVAERTGYDILE